MVRKLLVFSVIVSSSLLAQIQSSPSLLPSHPLGSANCLAAYGDTVMAGGHFRHVGRLAYGLALADRATGAITALPVVEGAGGEVHRIVQDPIGGWFVAGSFTKIDGHLRLGLARLLPNGQVDATWNVPVVGTIASLHLQAGVLWVGGTYSSIGGVARNHLAALDAATGAVLPFNAGDLAFPNSMLTTIRVSRVAVTGSIVYISGTFESVNGQARAGFAAFDLQTGALQPWSPTYPPVSIGFPHSFTTTASSGALFLHGSRVFVGNSNGDTLKEVDPTLGTDMAWSLSFSGTLWDHESGGNVVYLGGSFTAVGGVPRAGLAAVDLSTGLLLPLAPTVIGTVRTLRVAGQNLLLGGSFVSVAGMPLRNFAILDASTGQAQFPALDPLGPIFAVAATPSTLLLGGNPRAFESESRDGFAAFDAVSGALLPLQVSFDWPQNNPGTVGAFAVRSETLYISGWFTGIGGQARNGFAALDLTTGTLQPWAPDFPSLSLSNPPLIKAGPPGIVVYGGSSHLVHLLDANTGAVLWTAQPNNLVLDVAIADEGIYITGHFTQVDGVPRSYLALLNAMTGAVLPFSTALDQAGRSITAAGDALYVGGLFTTAGGQSRAHLAAIDRSTGLATSWIPGWTTTPWQPKRLLTVGPLLIAFSIGLTANAPAAFDRITGLQLSFSPPVAEDWAIAVAGGKLFRAGSYYSTSSGNSNFGLAYHALTLSKARAEIVGSGCGQPAPSLSAEAPVIGEPWSVFVQGPPLTLGQIWISTTVPAGPLNLAGCDLWLDLTSISHLTDFATAASGTWTLPLYLPPLLALDAQFLRAQTVLFTPNDLRLTNALDLTFGY